MTELRFRADLYSGFAIDAAVKAFDGYATFDLEKTDEEYVVRISDAGEHPEAVVADELGNYALGLTIEERSAGA